MRYVCHHRYKGRTPFGEVNIPAMTPCEEVDGIIYIDGVPLCNAKSSVAFAHFTRDDDGKGILRGTLTHDITKRLMKDDKGHQERWNRVWEDPACQPYKRKEHEDHWLWNADFYVADIDVLQHIKSLVSA